MANSLITPTVIAKEALRQLENNLVFGNNVHREYKEEFVKVGGTVNIRKPVKFTTTDGATASLQDVEEANTSITVDQRKHVAWKFSTQDLTLTVEEYSERYIKPAMITMANTVDVAVANLYKKVWNRTGTPGTLTDTFAKFTAAAQRMDEMGVPMDGGRRGILTPGAGYGLANEIKSLYVSDKAKSAYEKAMIGNIADIDTFRSNNCPTHTVGALGGTPLVNGASQNVTYATGGPTNSQSLITDGWTASAAARVKAGDTFTIAGVYAVNPVPGEGSTGKKVMSYLQQFVILADGSSDGSGNLTLSIAPAIITSGPFQTVSAAPADNAALTMLGTAATPYSENLIFHKNALALVTVPLEMPDSAGFKARESHNGLSIRVVKDYDFTNDVEQIRLDILYGVKAIYPDLAVRQTN